MLKAGRVTKREFLGIQRVTTLGQIAYVLVMANPDGVDTDELLAKIQEDRPSMPRQLVAAVLADLQEAQYIRYDAGRWYAPGPKPVIWESL